MEWFPLQGSVLVREGHAVQYDIKSAAVIRSLHISGTLVFATDRDTERGADPDSSRQRSQ